MLEASSFGTADSLGLGGLLSDACRVAQLMQRGACEGGDLLESLLAAALDGLSQVSRQGDWRQPASRRLAFRELGLAIGLSAIELIQRAVRAERDRFAGRADLHTCLEALASYVVLGPAIESFWLDPKNRRSRTWSEHRDINEVMLATSLIPESYLMLRPLD